MGEVRVRLDIMKNIQSGMELSALVFESNCITHNAAKLSLLVHIVY